TVFRNSPRFSWWRSERSTGHEFAFEGRAAGNKVSAWISDATAFGNRSLPALTLLEKFANSLSEHHHATFHAIQRRIDASAFHRRDQRLGHAGFLCQRRLRETSNYPNQPQIVCEQPPRRWMLARCHSHGKAKRRASCHIF